MVMVGMVVFFYWFGALRPFDKDVSVVVYDEGHTSLTIDKTTLGNGATYSFQEASSLQEMETRMANQDLGLVLPADFDQILASGGTPTLSGYIFWVDRLKVAELGSEVQPGIQRNPRPAGAGRYWPEHHHPASERGRHAVHCVPT